MSSTPLCLSTRPTGIILTDAQENQLEKEIEELRLEKALLEESQQVFQRTILARSCCAQIGACCCCPLSSSAVLFACILYCPCLCYEKRTGCNQKESQETPNKDILERITECFGCVVPARSPKNYRELCCTCCTPCCAEIPDARYENATPYYSLPYEQADERMRLNGIHMLSGGIARRNERIAVSHIKSPAREEMLDSIPSSLSKEELLKLKSVS